MDTYQNFAELARNEQEGRDFSILFRDVDSPVAVMAPHGGGIEPGTLDIAGALAGRDFAFYAFSGIKKSGNRNLHLTSNRFDEPIGLQIAQKAAVVVAVHGNREKSEVVFVGGRSNVLKQRICRALAVAGFRAEISDLPGIRGIRPENICNRGTSGEGVQLEMSRGLREKMFENIERRSLRKKTPVFYEFVDTMKKALLAEAICELNTRPSGPKRRSL